MHEACAAHGFGKPCRAATRHTAGQAQLARVQTRKSCLVPNCEAQLAQEQYVHAAARILDRSTDYHLNAREQHAVGARKHGGPARCRRSRCRPRRSRPPSGRRLAQRARRVNAPASRAASNARRAHGHLGSSAQSPFGIQARGRSRWVQTRPAARGLKRSARPRVGSRKSPRPGPRRAAASPRRCARRPRLAGC